MISLVNRGEMEIADYLKYHGLEPMDTFLDRVDREMTKDQRISFLNISLIATLTRWWKTFYSALRDWMSVKQAMKERFSRDEDQPQDKGRYKGDSSPKKHIKDCITNWERKRMLKDRWVHTFIHTLRTIP